MPSVTYPDQVPEYQGPDNPHASLEDLELRIAARKELLKQKAREAAAARGAPMPGGTMAGGFMVAPHWSQMLNNAIAPLAANFGEGRTRAEVEALQKQQVQQERQAVRAWLEAQPQGTPVELAGPTETGAPLTGQAPPSPQARMAWLQQGRAVPSLRGTIEAAFRDELVHGPQREETRANRIEDRDLAISAKQQADAAAREAKAAQDEEKRIAAKEKLDAELEYKREVERGRNERAAADRSLRQTIKEAADKAEAAEKAAKAEKAAQPKPLTPGELMKVNEVFSTAKEAQRFADTFKDDYAGVGSGASRAYASYAPTALTTQNQRETAQWWRDYQGRKNTVRHALFGTALTDNERKEWEKSDVSPDMEPGQVRALLKRRAELEAQAAAKLEQALLATTREGQLGAMQGGKPTPKTKTERDALPPGTEYVGPDGKTYRR